MLVIQSLHQYTSVIKITGVRQMVAAMPHICRTVQGWPKWYTTSSSTAYTQMWQQRYESQ